jgi:predicted HicB family RNase H-like nuclease
MLKHKGCVGSVEFSRDDQVFFGKLLFVRDLVTYEAPDAKRLEQAFREAVEDYLDLRDRS